MSLLSKTVVKIITILGFFAFLLVTATDPACDLICSFNTANATCLSNQSSDDDSHISKDKTSYSVNAVLGELDLLFFLSNAPFHDYPILRFSPRYIIASCTGRAPPSIS
jgi:hypothetical protein